MENIDQSIIWSAFDDSLHIREIQISVHEYYLSSLKEYCEQKIKYSKNQHILGNINLTVPKCREDERRHFMKRPLAAHINHSVLKKTNSISFFDRILAVKEDTTKDVVIMEDSAIKLVLRPSVFEAFFHFIYDFSKGQWGYHFEIGNDIWLTTDIINPSSEILKTLNPYL